MGTSLALIGAHILTGELGWHHDHTEAFRQHEALMRPCVTTAQKIPPGALTFASPQTRTAIAFTNAVLGFLARPAVIQLDTKLTATKSADQITLPDYEAECIQCSPP